MEQGDPGDWVGSSSLVNIMEQCSAVDFGEGGRW